MPKFKRVLTVLLTWIMALGILGIGLLILGFIVLGIKSVWTMIF